MQPFDPGTLFLTYEPDHLRFVVPVDLHAAELRRRLSDVALLRAIKESGKSMAILDARVLSGFVPADRNWIADVWAPMLHLQPSHDFKFALVLETLLWARFAADFLKDANERPFDARFDFKVFSAGGVDRGDVARWFALPRFQPIVLAAPTVPTVTTAADEAKASALARLKVAYDTAEAESRNPYWNDGPRGNVKRFVARGFVAATSTLEREAPLAQDTPHSYLARVCQSVQKLRGGGPDEDLESWYDGAIDAAASIISGAIPSAVSPPAPGYWTRSLKRSDLVEGNVFAHGTTRLNLSPADLSTFVDPADAALMFGFRALESGGTFESSFAVWMATLRRRGGQDAIIESLQRIFTQLVDEESLRRLLQDTAAHARSLGYEKVWLVPALLREPLFAAALAATADHLGHPLLVVPTSGMTALVL